MTTYTKEVLAEVLYQHALWLAGNGGRRAYLLGAYLLGANLRRADLRRADLRDANLRDANLLGSNLLGADLWCANLQDADLRDANLLGSNLEGANLEGANLEGANLKGARLSRTRVKGATLPTAPVVHNLFTEMHKRIEQKPACLQMANWHCGTAHCVAGHAVDLAGKPGYRLEKQVGPSAAGALIIAASCKWLGVIPDFSASDKDAAAAIAKLSKLEAAHGAASP